jgi:hypothetical protein
MRSFRFFSVWWGVVAVALMYRSAGGCWVGGLACGAWLSRLFRRSTSTTRKEARTYTLTSRWRWRRPVRCWHGSAAAGGAELACHALITVACLYSHYGVIAPTDSSEPVAV